MAMQRVRVTMDAELMKRLEEAATAAGKSRSAWAREVVEAALDKDESLNAQP
jgi:metal-responsive CopG/Arc/MetJ family transcriptional regulator